MPSELQILARPRYFQTSPVFIGGVAPGLNLAEIVEEVHRRGSVDGPQRAGAIVQLNGEVVPRALWCRIKPKPAAHIVVTVGLGNGGGGGGGKNPLGMVMSLAVIVAAAYAAPILASAAVAGSFTTATVFTASQMALVGTLSTVFTVGLSAVGLLAVNALFPARSPSLSGLSGVQSYNDSPTYSISGAQNEARPFSPVPVVLGRHRVFPPLGAKAYTEISGNDEYLRQLFVWGYGPIKIEDLKIGETPIEDYEDVEIETREGWPDDAPITLIPAQVFQDGIGVTLTNEAGWIQRTSKADIDEIGLDISFPSGLVYFTDSGGREARTVVVEVEYRAVGATDWIATEGFSVTDKFVGNLRKGLRWTVARGQYEVRARRTTADSTSDRVQDKVAWTNLRGFRNDHPVKFPFPLAMTAIRIRANEQLQGIIDKLNAICTSCAPVWDAETQTWGGTEPTQDPSALKRLVLTGPANARPRALAQIDDENLGAFYAFCEAQGYRFNMVRDYASSVWDTCADICSAARAAPTLIDGKWGAIMDVPDKPIVNHFTPRNSWGFKSSIGFVDAPHAFRVRFVDEENGFEQDERIVYDDGYDENNATQFEGIDFPGVTNRDLAWKFARYHIAQARLRPQTYTFNADFEHLVCQRGDLIRMSHDVPLWGGGAGRVKALLTDEETGRTEGVVLDEKIVMEDGKTYACRFRLAEGGSFCASCLTQAGETDTLLFQASVPVAQGPQKGDLAMFGQAEEETVLLLVKAVRPGADLTAEIECVDLAPEIYAADQGDIPLFNPHVTGGADPTKAPPAVPLIVGVESGTAALEKTANGIKARILVSLQTGGGTVRAAQFTVRYRPDGSSDWRYVQQSAAQTVVPLAEVTEGETYILQAKSISAYGAESAWTEVVSNKVIGQSERPADVTGFRVVIVDGNAYFSWNANTEIDHSHYAIRHSPRKDAVPPWGGTVAIVERLAATSATLQAIDGTYLAKAVDYSDNESANAAVVVVDVLQASGMTVVETIAQGGVQGWQGSGAGVVYDESLGGLRLESGAEEGTYTLDALVDLQEVFTVRATAAISSYGTNLGLDLYSLADLYTPSDLYGGGTDQTGVGVELRRTNDDPAGVPVWSDWEPFVVGDYRARAFGQIRLRLKGKSPSITPVVEGLSLKLEMKARDEPFNVTVPAGGARVTFARPFFVAPELGLCIENGSEGDRYTVTNKDRFGFDIAFTNGGAAVGGRIVSGFAKSYGEQAS